VKDATGKVTSLILHQNNNDVTMPRLDDAAVKRLSDDAAFAAKRFEAQQPAEGGKAAIARNIAELRDGKPNYSLMSPGLADATRQQLANLQPMIVKLGAAQTVTFLGVERDGSDTYDVTFDHGVTEWRIVMASDGKIDKLRFRELPAPVAAK
jgi:hypothetical protein